MKKTIILSLILLCVAVFLFWMGWDKYHLRVKTLLPENIVSVNVSNVSCGGRRSYIVFKHNGENHIVNIAYPVCSQLEIGEVVDIYYNPQENWYLLGDDGKETEDIVSMIGAGIMFLLVVGNFVRSFFLRRKRKSA